MKIACSKCGRNPTELPDDVQLAAAFAFKCRECCLPGTAKGARRLDIAHDPFFPRAHRPDDTPSLRPRPAEQEKLSWQEFVQAGFQFDRKTPKPIKPGPEWAYSDSFLLDVAIRAKIKNGMAIMRGRWRQKKTFREIAEQLGMVSEDMTVEEVVKEVRKAISVFRTMGNRLWAKKQRAEAKAKKIVYLSARAGDLAERGHSVRQIARIMGCSVGYASELRRDSELRRAA